MKNNAIINTNRIYCKWKLPNVTEWNVNPESGKGMCKIWDTDGSHLQHLCFDNITEYDPDVVFDKNVIFTAFCSKCCFFMKPTYVQVLINRFFFCLKVEGLIFILMYCMFRYSYNKIFWGPWNFSENQQKRWRWLATFFWKRWWGKS